MARQSTYIKDGTVQQLDKWLITDYADGATKNLTVEDLGQFFAKTGAADPSRVGFHFTNGGVVPNTNITAVPSGTYYYEGTTTFASVSTLYISTTDLNGIDFLPISHVLNGAELKLTDISNTLSTAYGLYEVVTTDTNNDGFLILTLRHLGSHSSTGSGVDIFSTVTISAISSSGAAGITVYDDNTPGIGPHVTTVDGVNTPIDGDSFWSAGDLFFSRIVVVDPGTQTEVTQIRLFGPYDGSVWGEPVGLTGIQGFQGVGVTNFSGNQDGVATSTTATTVTVTGTDPGNPSSDPQQLGTFDLPSGVQGVQGTSISDVESNNPTPGLGENQVLTFETTDPVSGAGELPTTITIPAGVQGDQGISYLALFRVVEKNSAGIAPVPSAPEGVVYNRETGYTNLPIDQWNSNPIAHSVQSESLYELRQDFNPATAFDADGNVTFTAASWGQAFVAGDIGPTGPQGVGLIDNGNAFVSDQEGVATSSTESTITVTGVDPSDNDSTVDLGTFTIPSGIKGDQGFQGVSVTGLTSDTPSPVPGDTQILTFATEDPAQGDLAGTLPAITLPPGVDGKEINSIGSSISETTGLLTLTFTFNDGTPPVNVVSDNPVTSGSLIQQEAITEWSSTDTYEVDHVVFVESSPENGVYQLNFYTAVVQNSNSQPSSTNTNWVYRGAVDSRQQLFNDLSNVDVDSTEAAAFRGAIDAQEIIDSGNRLNADLIADGSISNTEFQSLNGITSNIQTQLDSTVKDTGNESIDGVKTFTSNPKGANPGDTSNDTSLATTSWVRSHVTGGAGATNLGVANNDDDSLDITSSTGTNVTLNEATAASTNVAADGSAGLLSGDDKFKLDNSSVVQSTRTITIDGVPIVVPGTTSGGGITTLAGHNVTELDDVTNAGSGAIITATERSAIGTNSGKTSFPGFGTTAGTAAEGDALAGKADTNLGNLVTLSSGQRDAFNTSLGVLTNTVTDSSNQLVTSNGIHDYIDGLGLATGGEIEIVNFNDTANSGTTLGVDFTEASSSTDPRGVTTKTYTGIVDASGVVAAGGQSPSATIDTITIGGTVYSIAGSHSGSDVFTYSFSTNDNTKQIGEAGFLTDALVFTLVNGNAANFDAVVEGVNEVTGFGSTFTSNSVRITPTDANIAPGTYTFTPRVHSTNKTTFSEDDHDNITVSVIIEPAPTPAAQSDFFYYGTSNVAATSAAAVSGSDLDATQIAVVDPNDSSAPFVANTSGNYTVARANASGNQPITLGDNVNISFVAIPTSKLPVVFHDLSGGAGGFIAPFDYMELDTINSVSYTVFKQALGTDINYRIDF